MISKNNLALRQQKGADKKQHFGLRKLSIGVASVLLTSSFFLINNTGTIHADTTESADTTAVSSGTSSNDSTKSSTSTTTAQAESSSTTTKTSDTEAESTSSSTDGNTSKENSTQSSTTDTSATNGSTQSTDSTSTDNSTTSSTNTNTNQQSTSSTTGTTAASVGISLYSEDGTNDSLTTSLSDGTTLTISRNTIGATGDTSNLTITLTVANFQDGDQYTLTIPKGDTYNINDPSGQALTISGTTTSSQTSDAYVITDRFTRSQTGSAGVTQTFTITPKNNYQAEDTPMSEIGDVLKTITLTKVAADGTTSSTSLSFTQIINPEMSPSFSRFMPSDTGYYLLPNTDYTYILNVRETSGVASGDSWSSNRVNSTVNSGTTITIPVPTGFTLDASQTALANAFTDETTITQPDGAGGNIIITVPSGSGSQGYQGMAGYKIVGYYAVDQPTTDTTVTASGNITIDQTITNADGTTSKIEKTLSPWTDTLAGSETTSTKAPRTSTDAATYNSSHTIVSTVDESTPIAYFGFSNPTATNLTDSTISIQIADGLNVDRITTPVDSVNLPGLTSYTYTATLSDGSTISGTVTAGDDVTTSNGLYIRSIVFHPNEVAAGASTTNNGAVSGVSFKAYGTVASTKSDGTAITSGTELDSSITFSANFGTSTTYYATSNANQTVTEPTASVGSYINQGKTLVGSQNAGYIGLAANNNSAVTSHTIYEPVFYYVLPEGTYDAGTTISVPNGSSVTPKVTTSVVNGREVVKIDYTGTGYYFDTTKGANDEIYLNISPVATPGTYTWQVYVYSPTTQLLNPLATTTSDYSSAYTDNNSDNVYYLAGIYGNTWTITRAQEAGTETAAKGNQDEMAVSKASADDKGSTDMSFDFEVYDNTSTSLENAVAVINLADSTNENLFKLTGAITGNNGSATVLYSTSKYTSSSSAVGTQADLTGYVSADQVTDWSTIRSIAIILGNVNKNTPVMLFKLSGEDPTLANDAGKTIGLETYLFSDNNAPITATFNQNATITISGTSSVTAEVISDWNNSVVSSIDLSDLNHSYTDNSDTINQSDFDLTTADQTAIQNYLDQLNSQNDGYTYSLISTPTIISSDGSTLTFGQAATSSDNGAVVQYHLTRVANVRTISYQVTDADENNTVLDSGTLGSGNQGTAVDSSLQTTYDHLIDHYKSLGYKVSSQDDVPTTYGDSDQTLKVVLTHATTTVQPDDPKTTSDPLPDNSSSNYPSGVGESDLNKTITRTINLHQPDGTVKQVTQTAHLTRTATVDEVTGDVTYSDWTTGSWDSYDVPSITGYTPSQTSVASQSVDSTTNDTTVDISYTGDAQTLNYELVDDTTGQTLTTGTLATGVSNGTVPSQATTDLESIINSYTDQGYVLSASYTIPSTFDTDDNTDQVVTVHLKHGTKNVQRSKDVTQTIHYVYADGSKAADDATQTLHFVENGVHDNVTNSDTWTSADSQSFSDTTSPVITGYTADQTTVAGTSADYDSADREVTVTYTANDQAATITYIDDTTGQTLQTDTASGKFGETITFAVDPADRIADYEAHGYRLSSNNFSTSDKYQADNTENEFTVHLTHATTTVQPDDPKTTSDPLPDNPSSNYPSGVGESDLNKTVTRTINLHQPDGTVKQVTQTAHLTRTATVDEVTGDVTYSDWTTGTWDSYDVPSITGYTPSQTNVASQLVDSTTNDTTVDISYNGDAQTLNYELVDDTTGQTLKTGTLATGVSNGTVPSQATTDLQNLIANYTSEGYKLVSESAIPSTFDTDDNTDQIVTVHLVHGTKNVQRSKDVTQTIHYVYADGTKAADDAVQTLHFVENGVQDEVTGDETWTPAASQSFSDTTSPVITGYTADQATVAGTSADYDSADRDVTVTYTANDQNATITYIDDTTGQTLRTDTVTGKFGDTIKFTLDPADRIADYEAHGYRLSSNDFSASDKYQADNAQNEFTVHLTHATTTVQPDDPKTTSDPLPDNSSQNYPSGVSESDLNKTVIRTINLHQPDGTVKQVTQTAHLTRTATVDEVTGDVTYSDWTTANWDAYDVPTIDGYTASQSTVAAQSVDSSTEDTTVDVSYTKDSQDTGTDTPADNDSHDNGGNSGEDNSGNTSTDSSTGSSETSQVESNGTAETTANTTVSQPSKTQSSKDKLPQTGNSTENKAALGLGAMTLMAALSLLGFRRRRHDD